MDVRPIPFSSADLERRRLETTIDHDLHSLSLTTITSSSATDDHLNSDARSRPQVYGHDYAAGPYDGGRGAESESDTSFSSMSTIEYPRAHGQGEVAQHNAHPDHSFIHQHPSRPTPKLVGPHGTPRAATMQNQLRKISERSLLESSPVSTADHHVSAVTLADGVFARPMGGGRSNRDTDAESGSEWDPDRSLGRLVGELGKVMQAQVSTRPTSPFSPTRSPRSPSPYTTSQLNPNLSFTLNRADPLPSPPASRSGSGSSSGSRTIKATSAGPAPRRTALGESTAHNIPLHQPKAAKTHASKVKGSRGPGPVHGDVTGMTGLLETPDKGLMHGLIGRNADAGQDAADGVPDTLSSLHARLRALEMENSVSRRRVRELEAEIERAKAEVESARTSSGNKLTEAMGEKSALEDLVKSLRAQLSRLTVELEHHKSIVADLRAAQAQPPTPASPPRSQVTKELQSLRHEVERLSAEVHRLGGIVERGLETRKKARGEETTVIHQPDAEDLITLSDEDVRRVQKDVEKRSTKSAPAPRTRSAETQAEAAVPAPRPSRLRQGTHRAGSPDPELIDATVVHPTPPLVSSSSNHRSKPTTRRPDGPSSPFPSIREEDEGDFFDVSRRASPGIEHVLAQAQSKGQTRKEERPRSSSDRTAERPETIPPQTVLTRVIGELELDFSHYKSIYAELADQYKVMDAASAMAKRHVLAQQLKEVIDTLEQKADQIASLYSLLSFRDRPDHSPAAAAAPCKATSVMDVVRMVKETLGEEGLKRLEEDGVLRSRSASGNKWR